MNVILGLEEILNGSFSVLEMMKLPLPQFSKFYNRHKTTERDWYNQLKRWQNEIIEMDRKKLPSAIRNIQFFSII